ncbi:MAG: multidrug effflux MFS transporter [Bacteroidales bacterium]|nr:multidrug effflux MFS transporter [Bacteroidales bacterium]
MKQPSPNTQPSTPERHVWFFITFVVLISALGSFVNDMFTPALPAMCRFFHCTVSTAQLGLTTGMIGLAIGQLFLGPISDHIGRKPVLIGGVSFFVIASVVSVFSPTISFFVWCRLFQGIGASAGYFLGRTMPADLYSGQQLAKIMALIGAINGLAPASAPVFGGITADHFGWKGIFVFLAIFAVVILLLSPFVKETLPKARRTTTSFLKTFDGYKNLLVNKAFMIHVTYKGLSLGLLFAYLSAAPFILQTHYGFSQTSYGLIIGFNALFLMVASMLAPKFRPFKKAAWLGAILITVGVGAQACALWLVKSIWLFEIFMILILFGLGFVFTVTNTLSMNEGRNQAGEASSILGIAGYIFGAIVSPLVGIGDVLHSTAITFVIVTILMLIVAIASRRLAPDLNNPG